MNGVGHIEWKLTVVGIIIACYSLYSALWSVQTPAESPGAIAFCVVGMRVRMMRGDGWGLSLQQG